MDFSLVKEEETYIISNGSGAKAYYNIVRKGCKGTEELLISDNVDIDGIITFTPVLDGEYVVTIHKEEGLGEDDEEKEVIIISHYNTLIKSIVEDLTILLCSNNCGPSTDCNKESDAYIKSQIVLGNILLYAGITKTISCDNNDIYVIPKSVAFIIDDIKCDLVQMYCDILLIKRLTGDYKYDTKMLKKMLSIYYLVMYFYEREITSTKVSLDYLNNKYNYYALKACILKLEVDITLTDNLFSQIYYEGCMIDTNTCDLSCFKPTELPTDKTYAFDVGTQVFGMYDTITLRNTCNTAQVFVNRTIYNDGQFSVKLKSKDPSNNITIAPGASFLVDVVFSGTKSVYTALNIPLNYEGSLINTYLITFNELVVELNTPPQINEILIELDNRQVKNFTIADFENNFIDADGDILGKIVLVGDTTRLYFDGNPYISGTIITRNNINKLSYIPLDTDTLYDINLFWAAYDSRGLKSD